MTQGIKRRFYSLFWFIKCFDTTNKSSLSKTLKQQINEVFTDSLFLTKKMLFLRFRIKNIRGRYLFCAKLLFHPHSISFKNFLFAKLFLHFSVLHEIMMRGRIGEEKFSSLVVQSYSTFTPTYILSCCIYFDRLMEKIFLHLQ